jgi:deoxyribodipyrimidine photo-lyase
MKVALVWLRKDLRIHDNYALQSALQNATHILPIYCLDPKEVDIDFLYGKKPMPTLPETYKVALPKTGIFRSRFLLESLSDLRKQFRMKKSDLCVVPFDPVKVVNRILTWFKKEGIHVQGLYYQREVSYEELETEREMNRMLTNHSVPSCPVWGTTLYHIEDLPFQPEDCPDVFTQFRKVCEQRSSVRSELFLPLKPFPRKAFGEFMDSFAIVPLQSTCDEDDNDSRVGIIPSLHPQIHAFVQGGESAGLKRVRYYFWESNLIQRYKETRNGLVGLDYSSKFSPWLALGCLSPRFIYRELKKYEQTVLSNDSTYWLYFELLWRDFWKIVSLRYGPGLFLLNGPKILRKKNYTRTWKYDKVLFQKWIDGKTGIPFVDAAMRELKQTGYMSNRARQNVASFLVHSLGIDWRWGACYFESTLIDHDPESNYGNWQYVAGVGTDPREYRKFNMIKQAQDYDPQGEFVKKWCPELKDVPNGHPGLFMPWNSLVHYPPPIVIESAWKLLPQKKVRTSDWTIKK